MQTRLLACLAGGFGGIALTSVVNDSLGLEPTMAYVGCSLAGIALGYVVSTLFHVFAADSQTE
jgi:hypothetical protein